MLMATLLLLLSLGSGASLMLDSIDQMKHNIKAGIVDETARGAALEVVSNLKDTTKSYADADSDVEKELLKLIQRYETTTDELKNTMDISYQRRLQYQKEMLALRFELKSKLNQEQWDKVFSKDTSTQ